MHNPRDLNEIDTVLRLVDRDIWVVTASDGERRGGLVATWVGPASIDRERPVILAGLGPNHHTTELVQKSRVFAAHLLRPDQVEVAWNFAKDSGRERDKFSELTVTAGQTGAPILSDCRAWSDCRVFARYDAGDRMFFWADVLAVGQPGSGPALCEQELFRRLSEEQKQVLMKAREEDVVALRPGHEAWRNRKPW